MKNKEKYEIFEGCSSGNMCSGVCREIHLKNGCPSFYRYRMERRQNKQGKLLGTYTRVFIK